MFIKCYIPTCKLNNGVHKNNPVNKNNVFDIESFSNVVDDDIFYYIRFNFVNKYVDWIFNDQDHFEFILKEITNNTYNYVERVEGDVLRIPGLDRTFTIEQRFCFEQDKEYIYKLCSNGYELLNNEFRGKMNYIYDISSFMFKNKDDIYDYE